MFWDEETCEECGKPVNSENGYKLTSVLWEEEREDGSKSWGEDSSSFCSLECLFKWTWDLMIPRELLFSVEHPRSVVDVEAKLTWKDIERKKHKLLKLIGVERARARDMR